MEFKLYRFCLDDSRSICSNRLRKGGRRDVHSRCSMKCPRQISLRVVECASKVCDPAVVISRENPSEAVAEFNNDKDTTALQSKPKTHHQLVFSATKIQSPVVKVKQYYPLVLTTIRTVGFSLLVKRFWISLVINGLRKRGRRVVYFKRSMKCLNEIKAGLRHLRCISITGSCFHQLIPCFSVSLSLYSTRSSLLPSS